jgi:hypothetical protein
MRQVLSEAKPEHRPILGRETGEYQLQVDAFLDRSDVVGRRSRVALLERFELHRSPGQMPERLAAEDGEKPRFELPGIVKRVDPSPGAQDRLLRNVLAVGVREPPTTSFPDAQAPSQRPVRRAALVIDEVAMSWNGEGSVAMAGADLTAVEGDSPAVAGADECSRRAAVRAEGVDELGQDRLGALGRVDGQDHRAGLVAEGDVEERAALRLGGADGLEAVADAGAGGEPQLRVGAGVADVEQGGAADGRHLGEALGQLGRAQRAGDGWFGGHQDLRQRGGRSYCSP